jgi:hypothetical protein
MYMLLTVLTSSAHMIPLCLASNRITIKSHLTQVSVDLIHDPISSLTSMTVLYHIYISLKIADSHLSLHQNNDLCVIQDLATHALHVHQ